MKTCVPLFACSFLTITATNSIGKSAELFRLRQSGSVARSSGYPLLSRSDLERKRRPPVCVMIRLILLNR